MSLSVPAPRLATSKTQRDINAILGALLQIQEELGTVETDRIQNALEQGAIVGTGGDFTITLGDDEGVTALIVKNASGDTVATISSEGEGSIAGHSLALGAATIQLGDDLGVKAFTIKNATGTVVATINSRGEITAPYIAASGGMVRAKLGDAGGMYSLQVEDSSGTAVARINSFGEIYSPYLATEEGVVDIHLGDDAGATKLNIKNATGTVVAYIDSLGNVVVANDAGITGSRFLLGGAATLNPFVQLGDNAGARSFVIKNATGSTVGYIDSLGVIQAMGLNVHDHSIASGEVVFTLGDDEGAKAVVVKNSSADEVFSVNSLGDATAEGEVRGDYVTADNGLYSGGDVQVQGGVAIELPTSGDLFQVQKMVSESLVTKASIDQDGKAEVTQLETPILQLQEGAAPATPAAGHTRIYADANGLPLAKDDAGTIYHLAQPVVVQDGDGTTRTFTLAAYTSYTGLAVAITPKRTGRIKITWGFSANGDTIKTAAFAAMINDGSGQVGTIRVVGTAVAGTWVPVVWQEILVGPYSAGTTYTFTPQIYVYSGAGTITARYGMVMAEEVLE